MDKPLRMVYAAALRGYLEGNHERGLQRAHELGRIALEQGTGILEMAAIHHDALCELEAGRLGAGDAASWRAQAQAYFLETLSPFEMTHRGFQDALETLRRVNETMEGEARRIAHALHDETSQALAAACIALEIVDEDVPEATRRRLEAVGATLRETAERLRRISHELRPTILDDFGLVPALEFLAEGIGGRTGLVVAVDGGSDWRFPAPVETALYRVAQEAVANAMRHGNARRVDILLRREPSRVRCSIRDDGSGFDVAAGNARSAPRGLGLLGMRERVNALGGTFAIESSPGQGTELRIDLPTEARHAASNPAC